jgi:predicted phage tail protein
MLHTIKFQGFLGKKYGKEVSLAGANMFQLMAGLVHRFGPEFKEDIRTSNWHVYVGSKKQRNLGEEDLANPIKDRVIHLTPAIGGGSAAVRIVIGAVLVVAGVYFGNPWLVKVGAALVLGGVVEMLTKPKAGMAPTDRSDEAASALYNGVVNVTEQGTPVPIICGRVQRASSVVISLDVSSEEIRPSNGSADAGGTPPGTILP